MRVPGEGRSVGEMRRRHARNPIEARGGRAGGPRVARWAHAGVSRGGVRPRRRRGRRGWPAADATGPGLGRSSRGRSSTDGWCRRCFRRRPARPSRRGAGAGGVDCFNCAGDGTAIRVWENDRWKVTHPEKPGGLPLVLWLSSKEHLDYPDMDDAAGGGVRPDQRAAVPHHRAPAPHRPGARLPVGRRFGAPARVVHRPHRPARAGPRLHGGGVGGDAPAGPRGRSGAPTSAPSPRSWPTTTAGRWCRPSPEIVRYVNHHSGAGNDDLRSGVSRFGSVRGWRRGCTPPHRSAGRRPRSPGVRPPRSAPPRHR